MRRYTIGEVSRLMGVKPHVLRYWEDEIPLLAPQKSRSGRRVYTEREVRVLLRLKHLLYDSKYTIEGARQRIWEELGPGSDDARLKIAEIRSALLDIWWKINKKREEHD